MGERKVLNKYFPPDFDPALLPKQKRVRSEEKQMKVRMMLPMSVRCNTCGTYMYKGTKFNTRMEDVKGETYLGIKIFRFYYRCTSCSAEFCMKTDPKNTDYVVEGGATRNYEPWREREKEKLQTVAQREEEERGNAMKALENRTLDSRREMDMMAALDEMISLKSRHARVDTETALAALRRSAEAEGPVAEDLSTEDEEAVRQMLLQRAGFVKRLSESDEEEADKNNVANQATPRQGGGSRENIATGRSLAAAAFEEEEEQDLHDQIDVSHGPELRTIATADAVPRGDEGPSGPDTADALKESRPPAVMMPGQEMSVPSSARAHAATVTEIAMPRFGARRPAVVVKKKAVEAAKESPKREDSPDLQGLLGGYGSSGSD